jgi:uncharacterized protein YwgA
VDSRALALKLVLQNLGIDHHIDTVTERLTLQKAIYLAQAAQVDLGYSYGWYLRGPYSPRLTQDYYNLASLSDEDLLDGLAAHELKEAVKKHLRKVRALISAETRGEVSLARWLELLASLHYLLKVSHLDEAGARQRIEGTKPHLAPFVDRGIAALREGGFLGDG